MMSTTIATPATSSSPSKSTSPFEDAKRAYKWTFAAYVASLLLATTLTYLAGRSADRVAGIAQADADRRIAESSERAGKIENDNLELRKKIAPLEKDAADAKKALAEVNNVAGIANEAAGRANEHAARVGLETEALKKLNLELESKVEQERITRLKLQAEMAPRRLTYPMPNTRLKQFQGTLIHISFSSDDKETKNLAGNIVAAVKDSGWNVAVASDDTPHLQRSGVYVTASDEKASDAAQTLLGLLGANFIEASEWPAPLHDVPNWWPRDIAPGTSAVWVVIGPKSTEYLDKLNADEPVPIDERHKELIESRKKFEEEREAWRLETMRRLRKEWFPWRPPAKE